MIQERLNKIKNKISNKDFLEGKERPLQEKEKRQEG